MICGRRLRRFCRSSGPSLKAAAHGVIIALALGIIFVLRSGIPGEMLPREFGCSGMTCWRRLRDWQTAGVWTKLHRVLLERLSDAGQLDWS
jgi:transposase